MYLFFQQQQQQYKIKPYSAYYLRNKAFQELLSKRRLQSYYIILYIITI